MNLCSGQIYQEALLEGLDVFDTQRGGKTQTFWSQIAGKERGNLRQLPLHMLAVVRFSIGHAAIRESRAQGTQEQYSLQLDKLNTKCKAQQALARLD